MSENSLQILLQKLEQKTMMLLTEVEDLRNEIQELKNKNTTLELERSGSQSKLEELIALVDTVTDVTDAPATESEEAPHVHAKPVLVQAQGG